VPGARCPVPGGEGRRGEEGGNLLLTLLSGAEHSNLMIFNPLALELDIYSSAHHLCKM